MMRKSFEEGELEGILIFFSIAFLPMIWGIWRMKNYLIRNEEEMILRDGNGKVFGVNMFVEEVKNKA
eukprot:CAMPEP_0118710070 /NCGR_PEP_ID=MMETSP0800-20121206/23113_1 /TAXON_ID=210618 ORGANISM="Striatella unipunctata, Strain CCMP2910" /NCGR_SAMPLE_ID=MMETSP0800 /ASSEMBLY_ACC=CAM_ASM_000638 /LENGTH=66 /DNA_ID=CAMNT_0006614083 /DNA_START=126 /DNA_END=323 /DNA_ORIENTATION=+